MNHILIFEEPTTHFTKHPFYPSLTQVLFAREKGKMRNVLCLSFLIFDSRISTWRLNPLNKYCRYRQWPKKSHDHKAGQQFLLRFNKAKFSFSSIVANCNFINNKFHRIHYPANIFLLLNTKYVFLLFINLVTWSLSVNTLQTLGSYHFCIR